MCRLQNKAMRDYQESVITTKTHRQTDTGQSDPYVPLCFAGSTKIQYTNVYHIQCERIGVPFHKAMYTSTYISNLYKAQKLNIIHFIDEHVLCLGKLLQCKS